MGARGGAIYGIYGDKEEQTGAICCCQSQTRRVYGEDGTGSAKGKEQSKVKQKGCQILCLIPKSIVC